MEQLFQYRGVSYGKECVCVSLGGILGTIINYVFSTDGLNIYAY